MTPTSFLGLIERKSPPAREQDIAAFEHMIGSRLPEDYREFLAACNGGYVGGSLWFTGPTPCGGNADAGVHHIGGFRDESHFSLESAWECYEGRIPKDLVWIMDDPFGNAICLAFRGQHQGQIFFWDHENEPREEWNGTVEGAGNVQLLANSFREFVSGLKPPPHDA